MQGRAAYATIRNMKSTAYTRAKALPALLQQRILIIDGAMGTMIQRYHSHTVSTCQPAACRSA